MKRIVLGVVLLALGWWAWTMLFPGPEKLIRKRLAEVAATASYAGNEGALARLAHVQKFASCFSLDVEVVIDLSPRGSHTLSGRDEVSQAMMAVRSHLSALHVEFLDANVDLAADRQSAVVDLTLKLTAPGETDFAAQEMKFTLRKINGDWLITRVETVKTLS